MPNATVWADATRLPFIDLPAKKISALDLMDRALEKLRTVCLALTPDNEGWHDTDSLAAIWAVLDQAIHDLEPVQNSLLTIETGRAKV